MSTDQTLYWASLRWWRFARKSSDEMKRHGGRLCVEYLRAGHYRYVKLFGRWFFNVGA